MAKAVIPVKKLEEAKSSFRDSLDQGQRRELVLCMLEDVVRAASLAEGVDPLVVTPDGDVVDFVEDLGHDVMEEPGLGLEGSLEFVIRDSLDSGIRDLIYLPGDVPLVRSEDLEFVLDLATGDRCVVISPSEEEGTNAMLMRPPGVIDLRLGGESFPEHLRETQERGVDFHVYNSDHLARDMDSPEDLIKVETMGGGTRTHSFLESLKE